MEQCFRIAVCMFLLIGYLHAMPVNGKADEQCSNPQGGLKRFILKDLPLKKLCDKASCESSVTFTSPADVEDCKLFKKAVSCYVKGLEHARTNGVGNTMRINQTLEALMKQPELPNTECLEWENKGLEKSFAAFVADLEDFAHKVNNIIKGNN